MHTNGGCTQEKPMLKCMQDKLVLTYALAQLTLRCTKHSKMLTHVMRKAAADLHVKKQLLDMREISRYSLC